MVQKAPITATIRTACCAKRQNAFISHAGYRKPRLQSVSADIKSLINLWGADHHSYVTRMQAALNALGYPEGTLTIDLIQMVRMVENGVEVKMSKRTGNAITIRELCEDVGVDAARWYFSSKDISSQMDFDLKAGRGEGQQ